VTWAPPPTTPQRGPRYAKVTIDLFFRFDDPASIQAARVAKREFEGTDDVREVLHLSVIGTSLSQLGAEALCAAEAEGRLWPLFDQLLGYREVKSESDFERAAAEAGLDVARLRTERRSRDCKEAVAKASLAAINAAVRSRGHGAPGLLVNGESVAFWTLASEPMVRAAMSKARARAEALLDEGIPLGQLYEALAGLGEATFDEGKGRRLEVPIDDAPLRGPPSAPITVVLFGNLLNVPSQDLLRRLDLLSRRRPGQLRVAFHHLLPGTATELGQAGFELSLVATIQGRFWPFHELLLKESGRTIDRATLDRAARLAGIDLQQAARARDRPAVEQLARREKELAHRLAVPFIPALVVNGLPVRPYPSDEDLERVIDAELARGVAERLHPR
jgi:protein-disulfide isomerase